MSATVEALAEIQARLMRIRQHADTLDARDADVLRWIADQIEIGLRQLDQTDDFDDKK